MKKNIVLGLLVLITFQLISLIYNKGIKKIDAQTAYVVKELELDTDRLSADMLERNEYFYISSVCLKVLDLQSMIQMNQTEETEMITMQKEEVYTAPSAMQMDDGDIHMLLQIAAAEAGTEDVIGKALVLCVIKNRIESEEFPNTVREVIYQCKNGNYQFSPVKNEAYENAEVTADCYEALELVLSGWDESQGAVYFCTPAAAGKWHEHHLRFLFEHGNHRFYKKVK